MDESLRSIDRGIQPGDLDRAADALRSIAADPLDYNDAVSLARVLHVLHEVAGQLYSANCEEMGTCDDKIMRIMSIATLLSETARESCFTHHKANS